ncbi:hypothetical protein DAEQUDRAFT_810803 [Daedalea quercina L-15889]|uniref:Uncharacterized protein n=1 Tax=Daedalea quercina L-15889 TaxID=1314783 RepID=A0A165R6J8_9APHY|nr:hypothetical protein DAEQUDRAFT_810803 [Daedalea quercina L-15889]
MIGVFPVIVLPNLRHLALGESKAHPDKPSRQTGGRRRWWTILRRGQTTLQVRTVDQGGRTAERARRFDGLKRLVHGGRCSLGRGRDASVAERLGGAVPNRPVECAQAAAATASPHSTPFPAPDARPLISPREVHRPRLPRTTLGFRSLDTPSASVLGPYAERHAKGKDRCCWPSMQQKPQPPQPQISPRRGSLDNDCKRPSHTPRHASRRPADRHSFPPRTRDATHSLNLTTLCEVYEEDDRTGAIDGLSAMDHTLTTKENLAKIEDDWSRWRTARERNDHLRELQLDRRNIVLDSACPENAPHIVITPPDSVDAWNNYWASCVNRTGAQDHSYLSLPPRCDGLDPLACLPASASAGRHVQREATAPPTRDNARDRALLSPEPCRIFSRSRLCAVVALAAQERELLFLDNISTAVRRRQFRLAALDAASKALSFCARWEAPEFACRFEKPFQWTDEAEPLLSYFSHCLDTTVIDSSMPCTAPHIVIQDSAADEQYTASHHNPTPSQQDCYYLTVPSSFVHFVTHDEPNVWEPEVEPAEDCSSLLVADVEAEAEAEADSATAGSWSEGPATPRGSHFELGEAIIEEFEEYVEEDEEGLRPVTPPLSESGCAAVEEPASKVVVNVFECSGEDEGEEEEDLPPFDEWYQSIAGRATSVVAA